MSICDGTGGSPAPIRHYGLDGNTGDNGSQGVNGSLSAGTSYVDPLVGTGHSVQFIADGGAFTTSDGGLPSGTTGRTFSFFFASNNYVVPFQGGPTGVAFELFILNGRMILYVPGASGNYTATNFIDGEVHFCVVGYNDTAGAWIVEIDGTQVLSVTPTGGSYATDGTGNFLIVASSTNLDDPRMYNSWLSGTDRSNLASACGATLPMPPTVPAAPPGGGGGGMSGWSYDFEDGGTGGVWTGFSAVSGYDRWQVATGGFTGSEYGQYEAYDGSASAAESRSLTIPTGAVATLTFDWEGDVATPDTNAGFEVQIWDAANTSLLATPFTQPNNVAGGINSANASLSAYAGQTINVRFVAIGATIGDGYDVFWKLDNIAATVIGGAGWVYINPYLTAARGATARLNSFHSGGRGVFKLGYANYALVSRGSAVAFNPFRIVGRGIASAYGSFQTGGRGACAVAIFAARMLAARGKCIAYHDFKTSGRGAAIGLTKYRATARGLCRIANAALQQYELYRGVDAPADLTSAPWQTFASLPFTTPALTPGHSYHFVARLRNAWNLVSKNAAETIITVADDGTAAEVPPSSPSFAAAPSAAGTILVTSSYAYGLDGANQAGDWLVYLRSDGTAPDPIADMPTVVVMAKTDGLAKLSYTTAAFAEGTVVRVLVRARRAGTPDVDSSNTTAVQAIATLLGPSEPDPANAFLGSAAEQGQ